MKRHRHAVGSALALCLALTWLAAPAADTAYVYKPDGTRHCDASAEKSLDSMARELVRSGIAVHAQRKSHDGREGIALCGNLTGSINVYEIAESDVPKALKLGFRRLGRP